MSEIWKFDGGVYLGRAVEKAADEDKPLEGAWKVKPAEHRYTGDRHILTLGPNGSGKTMRLLLPNLYYLRNWSILVVDPKGELAMQTHLRRSEDDREVVTFDPFGVIGEKSKRLIDTYPHLRSRSFNPINILDPDLSDFPDDAKKIGEAIIKIEGKEPHWSQAAQALCTGVVMALRLRVKDKANFAGLREIITHDPKKLSATISELIRELPEKHAAISAKLNRFIRASGDSNELASVLATAITQTDWIDSNPIKNALGSGMFDFGEMKKRPITVYLILPPRFLETHATWLRLMITAVLMPLLRTRGGEVPVLFMLDEFAQLGRLEVIEQNLALMREYGVKLWPVFQDLSQAKDIYEKRWESFIGNAGMIQAFAPQDTTTRNYISELSGTKTYWFSTTATGTSENAGAQYSRSKSENINWHFERAALWRPHDLSLMEDGQGVLFSRGKPVRGFFPWPEDIGPIAEMMKFAKAAAG